MRLVQASVDVLELPKVCWNHPVTWNADPNFLLFLSPHIIVSSPFAPDMCFKVYLYFEVMSYFLHEYNKLTPDTPLAIYLDSLPI